MAKKTLVLAGLSILAIIVVLAVMALVVLVGYYLLIHYLIIPDLSDVKNNHLMTQTTTVNGSGPLYATQHAENGSLSFLTRVAPSDDCLLVALVDYRAVPFYFNGTRNQTHLLVSGSEVAGQHSGVVRITNLSEGYHDVLLVYFVAPANFSYNRWGMSTNEMLATASRFNVVADNGTRPEPAFKNNSTDAGIAYSGDYPFPNGSPSLALKPFDRMRPSKIDVKGGDVIDYYVTIGHPTYNERSQYNATFALVQLLDYGQIPARYNESEYTYYGSIGENETASVHLSLKAPETPGPHRLTVIIATNPYVDVEVAPDVLNRDTPAATSVEYIDIFVAKP